MSIENSLLSKAIHDIQASGCSLFFVTSSILSIVNGKKNRANRIENAMHDEQFQQELDIQKESYEDLKEAEERAFNIWLKKKQRDFVREYNAQKLDREYLINDMKHFFSDWPLELSIEAIITQLKDSTKHTNSTLPLNVIVGKFNKGQSRYDFYQEVVDNIVSQLNIMDICNVKIWRFKEDNKTIGGPALANIYAIMNSLPAAVILPSIDKTNHKLSICIGCWNQDSLFPYQQKLFDIDFSMVRMQNDREYMLDKIKEIKYAYTAIAAVLSEVYQYTENPTIEQQMLYNNYAIQKGVYNHYPYLKIFAEKEYQTLNMLPKAYNLSLITEQL